MCVQQDVISTTNNIHVKTFEYENLVRQQIVYYTNSYQIKNVITLPKYCVAGGTYLNSSLLTY